MALIDRGEYWQCAYVIPKGTLAELHERGLGEFRRQIGEIVPFLNDRAHELQTWDDVKLLTVRVNRLRRWYRPGLLCIGDAAHAMSPIGGVGINLAIQDAVAASNMLAPKLLDRTLSTRGSARRSAPARNGGQAHASAAAVHSKQSHRQGPNKRTRAVVGPFTGLAALAAVPAAHSRISRGFGFSPRTP